MVNMSPATLTKLLFTIASTAISSLFFFNFTDAFSSHSSSSSSYSSSVRGLPCVRRFNQLHCPTAGRNYPSQLKPQVTFDSSTVIFHSEVFLDQVDHSPHHIQLKESLKNQFNQTHHKVTKRDTHRFLIDSYIDENKAMIKRMFGEYSPPDSSARETFASFDGSPVSQQGKSKSSSSFNSNGVKYNADSDSNLPHGERIRRSSASFSSKFNDHNKIDTCESAVEIVTPYWASNSAGKIRAIVNTQHLQQAIQQEVCQSVQTKRCKDDCTCEQKYKWHRLLAYDPDDDCKGIFMDWFLFPSCCVCRCTNPLIG